MKDGEFIDESLIWEKHESPHVPSIRLLFSILDFCINDIIKNNFILFVWK